jgi:hypothetical protein
MPTKTHIARFTVPIGRQEIDLTEIVHDAGGMPFLRLRIRDRSRFTDVDVDPVTAQLWGEAMRRWGQTRQSVAPDLDAPD